MLHRILQWNRANTLRHAAGDYRCLWRARTRVVFYEPAAGGFTVSDRPGHPNVFCLAAGFVRIVHAAIEEEGNAAG